MYKTLTDADKELIESAGGVPVDGVGNPTEDNWGRIRFEKKHKPNRVVKKLLKEKGYVITKESGCSWKSMEYVLSDDSTTT